MAEDTIEKLKKLTKRLNDAAEAYYQQDREIMTNFEYDALYDELVALEKETGMVLSESPTDVYKRQVPVPAIPSDSQLCNGSGADLRWLPDDGILPEGELLRSDGGHTCVYRGYDDALCLQYLGGNRLRCHLLRDYQSLR